MVHLVRLGPIPDPAALRAAGELFAQLRAALIDAGVPIDTFQSFAEEIASLPGKYGEAAGGLLLLAIEGEESIGEGASLMSGNAAPGPLCLVDPDAPRVLRGRAVGCVALRVLPAAADGLRVSEVKRLFVSPSQRGSGLGRALTMRLQELARQRGHERLVLDCLQRLPAALATYNALGFRPIAPYCLNPLPDAVWLGLDPVPQLEPQPQRESSSGRGELISSSGGGGELSGGEPRGGLRREELSRGVLSRGELSRGELPTGSSGGPSSAELCDAAHSAPPASPPPADGSSLLARASMAFYVVCVGGGAAAQSLINTRASAHLGGVFLMGTAVSFGVGWCIISLWLLAAAACARAPRDGGSARGLRGCRCLVWQRRPRALHALPGCLGVLFVTAGVGLPPQLGYALFFVLCTAGFLTSSMALDHLGAFGGRVRRATPARLAAVGLALCGAVLTVLERAQGGGGGSGGGAPGAPGTDAGLLALCIGLATFAGMTMPLQAALNRSAAERLPSRCAAAWWSFSAGCVLIALALAAQLASGPPALPLALPALLASAQPWMYLGGPLGVVYIASGIALVRALGSATYFQAIILGQLAAAAVIDATGALGASRAPVSPLRGGGIALVAIAAAAMQLPDAAGCTLPTGCGARRGEKASAPQT